jgi:hypothetical protein
VKGMSNAVIPIKRLDMFTKSNRVLLGCLNGSLEYRNGEPYATISDALRGVAMCKESTAWLASYTDGFYAFSCVGFGFIDAASGYVALLMHGKPVAYASVEAVKNPRLLIGEWIEGDSRRYRVLDALVTESGVPYIAYN